MDIGIQGEYKRSYEKPGDSNAQNLVRLNSHSFLITFIFALQHYNHGEKNMENAKERVADIKTYDSVDRWLNSVLAERTGSERTVAWYARELVDFIDWYREAYDKDAVPDDLIIKAKEGLKKTGTPEWADNLAKRYFNHITKKFKRSSSKVKYGVVRSFFRYNGIRFVSKTPTAPTLTRTIIPPVEDLRHVWNIADLPEKIRIGALNDTGLRPSDVVGLTYADIKLCIENDEDYIYIEKVALKHPVWYACCFSKITTNLVKSYLEIRRNEGEVFKDTSAVITEWRHLGEPITVNMLYRTVKGVGAKVGVKISPRTFRKRFKTICEPIIGTTATCKMAGWKVPGVGEHYFQPNKEQTINEFKSVEKSLVLEEVPMRLDPQTQYNTAKKVLSDMGLDADTLLAKYKVGPKIEDKANFLAKKVRDVLQVVKVAEELD